MGGGARGSDLFYYESKVKKKIGVGVGGGLESVNFLHKDFKSKKKKKWGGGWG